MIYIVYERNGRPVEWSDRRSMIDPQGASVLEFNGMEKDLPENFAVVENGVLDLGPKPTKYAVYDYDAKKWVDARSQDEIDSENALAARLRRNGLLSLTDWTQVSDNPLSDEAQVAWQAYRSELRDLTDQPGFPNDIVWPVDPEGGS